MSKNKILRYLHFKFLQLQRWSLLHSKSVIILSVLVFIVLITGTSQLQFLLSIDDLIDPDFKTYQSLAKVNENFNDKNSIILSIESEKPFSKSFICHIAKWAVSMADQYDEIIRIQSTFGIQQAKIEGTHFEMKSYLQFDCTHNQLDEKLIQNRFNIIKKSPWHGILTTLDHYSLTFNIIIRDPNDRKFGSIDTTIVGKLKNEFEKEFQLELSHNPKLASTKLDSIKAFWGGILTYQSDLRKAFDQTQLLNGLMFILCLFIFRYFLSSWKAGVLFNSTIFFTLGLIYGLMGYLQFPVDVLTNATGLMIIISCLEDFVFIIYGMLKFQWSMRKSIRRFLLPGFFTSLTTAIGFGSLVTSELGIIRRFGVITAIATMCEWFICFIILPSILKQFPKLSHIQFSKRRFNLKDPFQNKVSPFFSYILIFIATISLVLWDQIVIKDSPNEFFFKNHIINKTSEHFLKSRGWVNELSLLFKSKLSSERKSIIINEVKKIPLVAKVEDSESVKAYLSANVKNIDKDFVHQLWEKSRFSKRLISNNGTERAQIFINGMENDQLNNLKNSINSICNSDCEIVGSLISYNEFSVRILETLFTSLGTSLILVVIIILFLGSSLSYQSLFAIIISSIWGPLALLTFFILFKIPLFFVSCICASILVGLAGDNAIQFIFNSHLYNKKKSKLSTSIEQLNEASLIITFGMMILTSVFLLSNLAPLFKLGLFILLGFILCYLGDIWILKSLLRKESSQDAS